MTIYLILISIITSPILFNKRKKIGLAISFIFLFILFGLQYEMSHDWIVYVNRWKGVNISSSFQSSVPLEYFYTFLMQLSKPIGFLGYLIFCAIFNLWVIYLFVKKYVPTNYYWIFFAIFMLRVNLGFTYINSNRQFLSITMCMLAYYIYSQSKKKNMHYNKYKTILYRYVIPLSLITAAINTHSSAIIIIPLFIYIFLGKYISIPNNKSLCLISLTIYSLHFFVDLSPLSSYVEKILSSSEEFSSFSHYALEINQKKESIVEEFIYILILITLTKNYNKFNEEEKPLVFASIVYIILHGFVMYTMLRALFYYQVYLPFTITFMLKHIPNRIYRNSFISLIIAYSIFSFNKNFNAVNNNHIKEYKNFKTIISSPYWF